MASRIALSCTALLLCTPWLFGPPALAAPDAPPAPAQSDSGYRVGDTLSPAKAPATSGEYNDILWSTLLPEGWNPDQILGNLNLNEFTDNDPRARDVLRKVKEMWDSAPVNDKLNNVRVRIPGFAVPLDGERGQVREFLLVPYFGACIHAPPPPANQIIHVVIDKAAKNVKLMDAIWVGGTMRTVRSDTKMGASGYELRADIIEPYKLEYTPF